ncbi:MAG: hypothetical protein ACKPKO_57600, partial [Candidatus Fonsibacter sp.]
MPAICQFDALMKHVTDLIPCRQRTQFCLQGALGNYHTVALLLLCCSRHRPMVFLQYDLPGIVGLPLQLNLIRDHLDPDWHTQEHQPLMCVVIGALANIICNLAEDGISLLFWSDHHQVAILGVHR